MKKKIALIITAVVLVVTTALTCTACNKKQLKLRKNMKLGAIIGALVDADVKSYTVNTTYSDGATKLEIFTQNGSYVKDVENGNERIEIRFMEDGKYYRLTKLGDEWTKKVYSLEGNKPASSSVDAVYNEYTGLVAELCTLKQFEKNGLGDLYGNVKVRVEKKNELVVESDTTKAVYYGFNESTLPIPEEVADYKSYETESIGQYNSFGSGCGYYGLHSGIELETYTILSEVDGEKVTSAYIDYDVRKIYVPTSIEKISISSSATSVVSIHYLGTVADLQNVTIDNYYVNGFVIHCTDGDYTVAKK